MPTSIVSLQNSLSAGELSPALFGRIDLEKWHSGLSTSRNFFSNYRGGVSSRAGLAYVGTCKQPGTAAPPRDIPFQFSLGQGYVLEFGDFYLRIKVNGAYITEAAKTVTSVNGSGVFATSAAHGYSIGDWVYDLGNTGYNGITWIINSTPSSTTFTVTDLFGMSNPSPTASGAGTVARIYTVSAPYAAVDLQFLKYTQSADTMTLCLVNQETGTEYPSYELVRNSNTNWVFTQDTFTTAIPAPTGLTVSASSSTTPTVWYTYLVTAVSSSTAEESVSSTAAYVFNNDIAINAGSNILSWGKVPGASSYNIYAATPCYGLVPPIGTAFGFIGSSLGEGFVDTNITPDFSKGPPFNNNPFARGAILDVVPTASGNNYSQQTIGYSIGTATGSGFAGNPVVVNSKFVGFEIITQGQGYLPGDTITLTDSGGGTATGYFQFSANPANTNNIVINGNPIEFVATTTGLSNQQTTIFATLKLTLQNLVQVLNSSVLYPWTLATYSFDGTNKINVTFKTPGSGGNAFTLAIGTAPDTVSGATLTGGGTAGSAATAILTVGPQTGTYPSVPAYFQQRRVYANSMNHPDTYWMSKPGLYNNMDYSFPSSADDFVTGNPWAQQVNGVQWLVPMPGGLVTLTGKGAWQVSGGAATVAITPSNQFATPQAFNGCHFNIPPIVNNYDILYVQSKGTIVRDLSYNFFVNIYTGTDLTVWSSHLFTNTQIQQWAWAEEPWKTIWMVKSDGGLLCLTFLKEQEVSSWTRHDTNGAFVSVASITETSNPNANSDLVPLVDSVYFIVKRYVRDGWRYYSERMDARLWENAEDSFCVDAGLTSPLSFPNATLTPSATTGTGIYFNASSSVFNSGMIGNIIRVDGGKATITGFTNSSQVICTVTDTLTTVVPNDPGNTPVPATAGLWSVSAPITVISGLNHLEGLQVAILADGSVVSNQTVVNGTVTLVNAASKVVVGLPYVCQMQTLYVDHPDGQNTSQSRRKLISSVGLRVTGSRGLQVGTDQPDQSVIQNSPTNPIWMGMNEIKERTNSVFAGLAVPLFTGDYFKNVEANWTSRGQLAVQQVYPLPANILSVILYWSLGDDK